MPNETTETPKKLTDQELIQLSADCQDTSELCDALLGAIDLAQDKARNAALLAATAPRLNVERAGDAKLRDELAEKAQADAQEAGDALQSAIARLVQEKLVLPLPEEKPAEAPAPTPPVVPPTEQPALPPA